MEKVVWSVLAFSLFPGYGVFARMRKMPLDRRGRVCWFIGLYDIYIGRSFRRAEKTEISFLLWRIIEKVIWTFGMNGNI